MAGGDVAGAGGGSQPAWRPVAPDEIAPVAERIAILRSALDELERELDVRQAK